jgi:hypothetical protein
VTDNDRLGLVLSGLEQVQTQLGQLAQTQAEQGVAMAEGFGTIHKLVAVDQEHISQLQSIVGEIKADLAPLKDQYVAIRVVKGWVMGGTAIVTAGLGVAKYFGII